MSRLNNTEHYDLHDENGEHHSTCSTADGRRVAQHEAALADHLQRHAAETINRILDEREAAR